jgi:nucleotide-binding universal stress UspA family protein
MSALGKLLRTYLVGRTDYGTTIPGGISPENAPVGSSLPYVVYQGISTQRQMLLRGTPAVITERVTLTAVAETRASAQGVLVWIAEQIEDGEVPVEEHRESIERVDARVVATIVGHGPMLRAIRAAAVASPR